MEGGRGEVERGRGVIASAARNGVTTQLRLLRVINNKVATARCQIRENPEHEESLHSPLIHGFLSGLAGDGGGGDPNINILRLRRQND